MILQLTRFLKPLVLLVCVLSIHTAFAINKNDIPLELQDGTEKCGMPVCNIDKALETLKGYWPNVSGSYAGYFYEKYEKESNPTALKNLYDFSKGMVDLYETLHVSGEYEWVVGSANNLYGMILINLVKNSEVKAGPLVGYFNELRYQGQRHSVLEFWTKKAEVSENLKYLEELFIIGEAVREQCRAEGDEDWVVNTASYLLTTITSRIVMLDPSFEGLYEAQIDNSTAGMATFDRIVILGSATSENLMVSFVNSKNDSLGVIYSYEQVELSGNVLRGIKTNDNYSGSSSFEMSYDRATGGLTGQIMTTAMERPLKFSGIQVRSLGEIFEAQNVAQSEVEGFYTGTFGKIPGTLAIKSFVSGSYAATFTADNRSLILHFRGKYLPENGVTMFTSSYGLKLALSFRKVCEDEVALQGFGYSLKRGTAFDINFTPVK